MTVTATTSMSVRMLSGPLGAEISGVDLASADDAVFAKIEEVLFDRLVVVFRDQELRAEDMMAFARRFGEPNAYPLVRGLPGWPEITPVIKRKTDRNNFGGVWHSDTAYLASPPSVTIACAIEVPPVGGDTCFANQYLAYERMPQTLKDRLDLLSAVHVSTKPLRRATRAELLDDASTALSDEELRAEHRVVRRHPVTGRKALYVSIAHTVRILGLAEDESERILSWLFEHQIQPELVTRVRWQPNTIVVWDNRCTMHQALNDYQGHRRILHRVTVGASDPRLALVVPD